MDLGAAWMVSAKAAIQILSEKQKEAKYVLKKLKLAVSDRHEYFLVHASDASSSNVQTKLW